VNVYHDRILIQVAALLRSFGVGLMGVVLGVYLSRSGYSSLRIGVVVAVGLAGSALATTAVGLAADRLGRKRFLIALSLLSTLGGLALYMSLYFPILLVLVFLGMLNGTGTERSAMFVLEQAMIPGLSSDIRRTWNLAFYNVLIDGGGSLGALGAGFPLIPRWLRFHWYIPERFHIPCGSPFFHRL